MGIATPLEKPQHLTRRQRRAMAAARKVLGDADVRAYATGRAQARMSNGVRWMIGIFSVAFVGTLVAYKVVLVPGVLLWYVLYDGIRPRRGVAVTGRGVAELGLSSVHGRPASVISVMDPGALSEPRVARQGHQFHVQFTGETVTVTERDYRMLSEALPVSVALPPPPMPGPQAAAGSLDAHATMEDLPRWRRASLGWILAHLVIAIVTFVAFIGIANLVTGMFDRDANRTSPTGISLIWISFAAILLGWYLFVYVRRSSFVRRILLATLIGGALVFTCVVDVVYSPVIGP
jgi:hypothetical protein